MQRIDKGSCITVQPVDVFINSVIPRDMASHFLFDGEHAEIFIGEGRERRSRGPCETS